MVPTTVASVLALGELGGAGDAVSAALVRLLADCATRGTLVLLGASGGVALLRRGPASARHSVWAAAIVVLGALPILTRATPPIALPIPIHRFSITSENQETQTAAVMPGDRRASRASGQRLIEGTGLREGVLKSPRRSASMRTSSVSVVDWVALAWLLGALTIATRLFVGTMIVRRRAACAQPVTSPEWLTLLREISQELGVRRRAALLMASSPTVPITWGIFRPVVLLPGEAQRWSLGRRRAVLLHEIGHAARFDAPTQLIAQLVLAVNWFNPLAWFAVAQLRAERERACDDMVLTHGTRASDYANELLVLARSFRPTTELVSMSLGMARESDLEWRLISILDPRRRRTVLSVRTRLLSLAVATPFVTLVAAGQPYGEVSPSQGASLSSTSARFRGMAVGTQPTRGPVLRSLSTESTTSLRAENRAHPATVDIPSMLMAAPDTNPLNARVRRGKAVISGRVTDMQGRPIAGATVSLEGASLMTQTAADGSYTLRKVSRGKQTLIVDKLQFVATRVAVHLLNRRAEHTDITLSPATPQPEARGVDAAREETLGEVGFTTRRHNGAGHYITEDEIAQARPIQMTDMFTYVPGTRVDYSSCYPVLTSSADLAGGCVSYVIDGVATELSDPTGFNDLIHPGQVAAIEVYGPAETPSEFRTREQATCEVIVIWTKARIGS